MKTSIGISQNDIAKCLTCCGNFDSYCSVRRIEKKRKRTSKPAYSLPSSWRWPHLQQSWSHGHK